MFCAFAAHGGAAESACVGGGGQVELGVVFSKSALDGDHALDEPGVGALDFELAGFLEEAGRPRSARCERAGGVKHGANPGQTRAVVLVLLLAEERTEGTGLLHY